MWIESIGSPTIGIIGNCSNISATKYLGFKKTLKILRLSYILITVEFDRAAGTHKSLG